MPSLAPWRRGQFSPFPGKASLETGGHRAPDVVPDQFDSSITGAFLNQDRVDDLGEIFRGGVEILMPGEAHR
jgi:hypothetical protein